MSLLHKCPFLCLCFLWGTTLFGGYIPLNDKSGNPPPIEKYDEYQEAPAIEGHEETIPEYGDGTEVLNGIKARNASEVRSASKTDEPFPEQYKPLAPEISITSFPTTAAVKKLALCPMGTGILWYSLDGAGLARLSPGKKIEFFGPAKGLQMSDVKRIQVTKQWVLALGTNGNLQLFERSSEKWMDVLKRQVEDAILFKGALFSISFKARRVEVGGFDRVGRKTQFLKGHEITDLSNERRFISDGENLYLWTRLGLWHLTKEECRRKKLFHDQIVSLALKKNVSIAAHGFGVYSLFENGRWREVQSKGGPKGDHYAPFILADEPWIGLEGGLLHYSSKAKQWSFHSSSQKLGPAFVNSAATLGENRYFSTERGELFSWSIKEELWRKISLYAEIGAQAFLPQRTFGLVAAKKALYLATDVGLYEVEEGTAKLLPPVLPSPPAASFVAVAALSDKVVAFSDGTTVHLWLAENLQWSKDVIDERATHLMATVDGKLWCAAPSRLTRWALNPLRKERVIVVPREPLMKLVARGNVIFGLTTKRIYRVDLRTGTIRVIWHVPPPLRLSRGRWSIVYPTTMVIDSAGIILSTLDGKVRRVFWFDKIAYDQELGDFKEGKTSVTAMVLRGASLYAALSGHHNGVWVRDVTEPGGQWRCVVNAEQYGGHPVDELIFCSSGLLVRTKESVSLVLSDLFGDQNFDGSHGTTNNAIKAMTVRRGKIWVAGKGFSLIEIRSK